MIINFEKKYGMEWLTPELQLLFNLSVNTTHKETKRLIMGKIAEARLK